MKKVTLTLLLALYSFITYSQDTLIISSITITGNKITKNDIIMREISFNKNNYFTENDLKVKIKESLFEKQFSVHL